MAEIDFFTVAESAHDVQNPISKDKLRLVATYLGLARGQRVLDVGCGRGWWPVELATAHGADVTGVESNEEFATAAVDRAAVAEVPDRVHVVRGPATDVTPATGSFDVVTCLGATFALGGLRDALGTMRRALRDDGRIAVGEVHAADPLAADADLASLAELVHICEEFDLELTALVTAGVDEWDHYESQRWTAVDAWASRHPDHPQRSELLARSRSMRNRYLSVEREQLGWSVLVMRHRSGSW